MNAAQGVAALLKGAGVVVIVVLAACAGQPTSKTPATKGLAATAPAAEPLDASYDWRGLVLIPFGTLLKSSPIPLHEVLLFHDDSYANPSELGKDCFAVDGKPPRLAEHEPEEFLLCFAHDRLDRVEATVSLKAGEGPAMLARICAAWLKNPAPPAEGSSCAGHDGEVSLSARLGRVPSDGGADAVTAAGPGAAADAATGIPAEVQTQPSVLSVVLSQSVDRGASAAPEH